MIALNGEPIAIDLAGETAIVEPGEIMPAGATIAAGIVSPVAGQVTHVQGDRVLLAPGTATTADTPSDPGTIKVFFGRKTQRPLRFVREDGQGAIVSQYIRTTPGRIIFNRTVHQSIQA
jgi:hypothetical protein